MRECVCLESEQSEQRASVFLPQLLTREVKEQLEVGRWHYIFNEASQLFSFTVGEQSVAL